MPLNRNQRAQKPIKEERRILLANTAIQNGRITTVAASARSFDIPHITLIDRMKGTPSLYKAIGIGHKITQLEEETI